MPRKGGWYFERQLCAIWHWSDKGWLQHGKILGQTRTLFFHQQGTLAETPTAVLEQATIFYLHYE